MFALQQDQRPEYHALLMFFLHRRRRGPYPLASESAVPYAVKWLFIVLVLCLLLFLAGRWVLVQFGVGNALRRTAVALQRGDRGTVNVSLEGGTLQRAQNGMKLYAADLLTTGAGAEASLFFFDGSFVQLAERTELVVTESALGQKESRLALELRTGQLWVAVPPKDVFTGAILRTIATDLLSFTLPSRTEGVFASSSLVVFAADGPGITVHAAGGEAESVFIGEGQQLRLPDGSFDSDLYTYRSPIDPAASPSSFVRQSRQGRERALAARVEKQEEGWGVGGEEDTLAVMSPAEGTVLRTATVNVAGKVGAGVSEVKVNEYEVALREDGTFTQELAIPDGEEEFSVQIVASDRDGNVLDEAKRTVRRAFQPIAAPTITNPAADGQIYRTQRRELILRGGAPPDAAGVLVNDYRLQLFEPGNLTWSYLASEKVQNLNPGTNTYRVVAMDAAGKTSEPAVLTIMIEEGAEGVIERSQDVDQEDVPLPSNPPLLPGSLTVTGPTPGLAHTSTGSAFLIEGTTAPETASIWVNDYRLQLFLPGKTTWNYIASTELTTLKRGKNVYRIVARNSKKEILDALEYIVTYEREEH